MTRPRLDLTRPPSPEPSGGYGEGVPRHLHEHARGRNPDPYAGYDPGMRTGLVIFLGLVEAGLVALALLAASYWQATSESVALPAQERGLASLTEVDALIALRQVDLQRALDEGAQTVALEDFPVAGIEVDRSDVESASGQLDAAALRGALLAAGAARVYERGAAALRAPDAEAATPAGGAPERLVEAALDGLTRTRHGFARAALVAAGGAAVVLGALLLLLARGRRWLSAGLAVAGGGLVVLVLALVSRWLLTVTEAAPGSATAEYARLARTILDLPLWNGLALALLGAAVAAVGVPGWLRDRRSPLR